LNLFTGSDRLSLGNQSNQFLAFRLIIDHPGSSFSAAGTTREQLIIYRRLFTI
jgi:hypothetical protein